MDSSRSSLLAIIALAAACLTPVQSPFNARRCHQPGELASRQPLRCIQADWRVQQYLSRPENTQAHANSRHTTALTGIELWDN